MSDDVVVDEINWLVNLIFEIWFVCVEMNILVGVKV